MPPSLVDLTFVHALKYALQTGETDCLDPWLPGNLLKVRETLRVHNPFSAIDLAQLSKAMIAIEVTQTKTIDISHFPNLRHLVLLHTIPTPRFCFYFQRVPNYFIVLIPSFTLPSSVISIKPFCPAVFSHNITKDSGLEVLVAFLPHFTPDQLAQAFTDYLSVL